MGSDQFRLLPDHGEGSYPAEVRRNFGVDPCPYCGEIGDHMCAGRSRTQINREAWSRANRSIAPILEYKSDPPLVTADFDGLSPGPKPAGLTASSGVTEKKPELSAFAPDHSLLLPVEHEALYSRK